MRDTAAKLSPNGLPDRLGLLLARSAALDGYGREAEERCPFSEEQTSAYQRMALDAYTL